jgi:Transglycosylase SLT domain
VETVEALTWRRPFPAAVFACAFTLSIAAARTAAAAPVPVPAPAAPPIGVLPAPSASPGSAALAKSSSLPRQLIVPDLLAVVPAGLTPGRLASIRKLSGVRSVLAIDGGEIKVDGKTASVIGVPAQPFRSWSPPATAADNAVWADLSSGKLITTRAEQRALTLKAGTAYPVTAATTKQVPFGAATVLSVPGIDAVVDSKLSASLGLVRNVGALINAPAADLSKLISQVRAVTGAGSKVVNLVPVVTATKLPVAASVPAGKPANYLELYQESAARYCPRLSWTVLAAIGEIESGDGANNGPSTAGALGPMQFMPATWAAWGIDGFGETGTPNIMDPLDAVPSAARMLCADGAGSASSLRAAIFDYNHADWYVSEVLALATEYAQAYH